MGIIIKRFLRVLVAGFLGGAASGIHQAVSSGQAINAKNVLVSGAIVGGITGAVMAAGKALRDATGHEVTP